MHYNLGKISFENKDWRAAKRYFTVSDSLLGTSGNIKQKLANTLALGKVAVQQYENDTAFGYFKEVLDVSLANQFYDLYTEAVLEYGQLNINLKNYDVAEMTLAMAYTNAIQWNRLELQKKIINSLRKTYSAKGDYENAYNLMTQLNAVSESISRQQNSKAIQEIEVKYQSLQKENQIYELKEEKLAKQAEIERQKTIKKAFLYGFLVLLIPIISLLYVYYQKLQAQSKLNQQEKELSSQKITSLLHTQELELARTSLEAQREERHRIAKQLHDSIGGNLAGIKLQLANVKESSKNQKTIIKQVNETYELVRDISHDLVPKKFHQNAFTFLIENYIAQLRDSSELKVNFYAHPKAKVNEIPSKLKVELYQILQELFTNTIKHANAKNVEVHLNILDSELQLLYEDDGRGFAIEKIGKGIGLQNIESRLQQLNSSLMLDSAPKRGTVVTIEIPLKE